MYIFLWIISTFVSFTTFPPLSETEAERSVSYLKKCPEIVIYNRFDNNFTKKPRRIKIKEVSFRKTKHNYYEIVLEGTQIAHFEIEGEQIREYETEDVAVNEVVQPNEIFVSIRNNDNFYKIHNQLWRAKCLAEILEMPYQCCIEDFEYPLK
jgi:hypothetical protein